MSKLCWCVPAGVVVVHALAGAAMGQATFQGLGFVGGSTESRATCVSANGKTVYGYGPTGFGPEPWRWKAADGILSLNDIKGSGFSGEPRACSDDGLVTVGTNLSGFAEAWRWSQADGEKGLGYLPGGTNRSGAFGIAGDGVRIAGWSVNADGQVAVYWDYPGGIAKLGTGDLAGGPVSAVANAVNKDGLLIAGQGRSSSGREAWRFKDGVIDGLSDLSGGAFESSALGISLDGKTVVGYGNSDLGREAFIWYEATGHRAIGDLPGGGSESVANAVSGDGAWVVGYGTTPLGKEAFVWHKDLEFGSPQNLKSYLIKLGVKNLTGWTLTEATAISRDGRSIVGYGTDAGGKTQAWRAFIDQDMDGDGIYDTWETKDAGIDSNGDGTIDLDLYALGARPDSKDLFLEVDAMAGFGPSPFTVSASDKAAITAKGLALSGKSLDMMVAAFARAPVSNPDGSTGIRLHIKIDKTDLPAESWEGDPGDADPPPIAFGKFDAVKASNFGDRSSERVREAQKLVYRYTVMAKQIYDDGTVGIAELPGNDFIVALGPMGSARITPFIEAGCVMHEMGHTMGLKHGGTDHTNGKPNYFSIMNYVWFEPAAGYKQAWKLDYSRVKNDTLNEGALSEAAGVKNDGGITPIGPEDSVRVVRSGVPVDFNRDGDEDDTGVHSDLTDILSTIGASPDETLPGAEDWSRLLYDFRGTTDYSDAKHSETGITSEPTPDGLAELQDLPGTCGADCNSDGRLNVNDFICFQRVWRDQTPYGDYNSDKKWNVNDFIAFQADFRRGCP